MVKVYSQKEKLHSIYLQFTMFVSSDQHTRTAHTCQLWFWPLLQKMQSVLWMAAVCIASYTHQREFYINLHQFFFLFFLYFALFWELDCEWVGHPCSTHNIPAQTQTHKVATPNNNIRHGIQQSHSSGACRTPNYGHFGILYVFFFFMPTHSRIVVFVYIQYACNMVWYTVFY